MNNLAAQIEKKQQARVAPKGGGLRDQITAMTGQFQTALPTGMSAERLVRDAMTCLSKTPELANCTPASVLGGLMTCAQLGLRPGVLGHAHLIPFKNQAQLVIGYQGLVELAHRTGRIQSLIAHTVHANDELEVAYGLDDTLVHRPNLENRGDPIGYYAVAKFTGGGHVFYYMTKREVEAHRDQYSRGAGRSDSPWKTAFDAMAKKTVTIQLMKWAPKATEAPGLADAIAADETVRVDYSPTADPATVGEYPDPDPEDVDVVTGEIMGEQGGGQA